MGNTAAAQNSTAPMFQTTGEAVRFLARKTAEVEKATYFMEGRQDIAASLPSDRSRHLSQWQSCYDSCENEADRQETQTGFHVWREDTLTAVYRQSCLEGCYVWLSLPGRLRRQ